MGSPAPTICGKCQHSNPFGSILCSHCNASLSDEGVTITGLGASEWTHTEGAEGVSKGSLVPGSVIAGRYEIIKLLGEGGMGAVYKARDRELDRLIALKIIRPELAGHPQVLARFKQELLLARQVTHKNVIRIFDLSVFENLKFITMEFVEGKDLSCLLDQRKCTVPEALDIIQQTCRALEAAHGENVVHRDLKPQNIMLGEGGRVSVMDFGLARSLESTGLTQAGALMGTPAYMSPEQALGKPCDARSDIFSLGIIFYEMLTGTVPFKADTMLASMLKRTQGPPPPPADVDPEIPKDVSDVVLKCLGTEVEERYQTTTELLNDIDILVGVYGVAPASAPGGSIRPRSRSGLSVLSTVQSKQPSAPAVHATPRMRMMADSSAWKWIAVALGVFVLALGGVAAWLKLTEKPNTANLPPMTVMIADFNNHTGDSVFTGTLESTLKLALEGASFISAFDRTRMRDLGLKQVSGTFDEAQAQATAASQGLNVVVSGALDRNGSNYQITVRAVQTVTGKVLITADETAPNKDQVLFAVTKLGAKVRKALGDSTSESDQRLSMETLTAASLEAVHEYAAGLNALSAGKFDETLQHGSRAVDLDQNFGMAYSVMASAARNLGRPEDAEKYIREALKHIDRMTERERYRTRAYLYLLTDDNQKCVDEYGSLLQKYPADTGAYTNMSVCLLHLRNVTKSVDAARHAAAILPKRAIYHANLALSLAYSGDAQGTAKEAAEALKLGYKNGYLHQAYAALLDEQPDRAAAAYEELAKSIPSDAATALADLAAFEGRYSDAVRLLEKGIKDDLGGAKPDNDAAATKLWLLADVQIWRGQKAPAVAAAKHALEISQAIQTKFVAGQVYAAAGELAKARELAKGLSAALQLEPQAYGKLIEGEAALQEQNARAAVQLFTDANNILDTWLGRFDLGRAYLALGAFPEADAEFDRAVKRRGEALTLFIDLPTYSYFPPVYYYQGRAREGMKSSGFADSYKKYLNLRGKAGEDPLVADVRHRMPQ